MWKKVNRWKVVVEESLEEKRTAIWMGEENKRCGDGILIQKEKGSERGANSFVPVRPRKSIYAMQEKTEESLKESRTCKNLEAPTSIRSSFRTKEKIRSLYNKRRKTLKL